MAPALRETAAKQEAKKKAMATAAIVFGDSIVDPGNNNDLFTLSKANHLPYGKDLAGHIPTGRFSNGLIPSDFLGTRRLNLKQLLPPYLGVAPDSTPSPRGAQRIGFVGLPPIGSLPCQRTFAGGLVRRCVPDRNRAAQLYNSKAQELMAMLQGKEPGGVLRHRFMLRL
ncbi:GDSL esterase/lipase At2g24560-like [Brachypodium distachyon]|uniref:GDSL esterase/lipase At2g24560-like n=1 Tax=Brachypodium distachyon TaxID=15368 RepID=UPI00052FE26B|nr:GDSL esterase/lipase At2g24560-like [Brachypodium distachyon]|eukprot:XP_010239463.1 GDSL esterase/lipase At2g24560-like [Brachypodium distachyon]